MKLSPQQFEDQLKANRLVISLIGMSNIGKSYWSRQFASIGFCRQSCDDSIEEKLGTVLTAHGYSGIEDVSRWMGQPYDEQYEENQHTYLSLEQEVLRQLCKKIDTGNQGNTIIDTTGSVVHTEDECCQGLKDRSLMLYIRAGKKKEDEMFERYLSNPRPVVFGDEYRPQDGEEPKEALQRCYRNLLRKRTELYEQWADISIDREAIDYTMTIDQFLTLLRQSL